MCNHFICSITCILDTPPPPSMQSWAAHLEITTCIHISYPTLHGRGKGVLILKNFSVVAMDLDMSMLLSIGLKKDNGIEMLFHVLSGWLFFSQTPDSNFKLISIHLLQQRENISCDFEYWIVPEFWKSESKFDIAPCSCFVGAKKIDSLTSCVLCLWAPRWLVLL